MRELKVKASASARASAAEVDVWRKQALSYLAAEGDAEVPASEKPKKLYRVAAKDLALAIDNSLSVVAGFGLSKFSAAQADDEDYIEDLAMEKIPTLVLSMDQGSIGSCLTWYCIFSRSLRLMPLWDPSHRGWNDLKLATQDASLWSSMLVLTIAANCLSCPWNGSKFWQESKEGLEAFLEVASQDDPLFQSMLPGMLQDEGLLHTQTDQEVAADMFEGLRANRCWERRGQKISLGRWFGFFDGLKELQASWHSRLLVLIFLGVAQGWVSRKATQVVLSKLGKAAEHKLSQSAAGSSSDKVPMAQSNQSLGAIRRACQNTLHLKLLILSDPGLHLIAKLMSTLTAPLRLEHGLQAQAVRSPQECCRFYSQLAQGAMLKPLSQTVGLLQDSGALEGIGFLVGAAGSSFDDPSRLEDQCVAQQELAERAGEYTVAMLSRRYATSVQFHSCLPAVFATVAHGDGPQVTRTLAFAKAAFAAFQAAQAHPDCTVQWWRAALKRSVFHMPVVRSLISICVRSGWECTPELKYYCSMLWSAFGQTKLVEDAFQRERAAEKKTENGLLSKGTVWHTPIGAKILSQVHQFKEVRAADYTLKGDEPAKLPHSLHTSSLKQSSIPLDNLAGTSTKGSWPSWMPANLVQQAGDLQVLLAAHRDETWSDMPCIWKSQMMCQGLLCRPTGRSEWRLSLGGLGGAGFASWPCELVQAPGFASWKLSCITCTCPGDIWWEACLSWDSWEVQPFEWVAPVHFTQAKAQGHPGICMKEAGPHMPLLRYAASQCFWKLGLIYLNLVLQDLGMAREEVLWEALNRLLEFQGFKSEADKLQILGKRLSADHFQQLLGNDELVEVLDQSDQKEVEAISSKGTVCLALLCSSCLQPHM